MPRRQTVIKIRLPKYNPAEQRRRWREAIYKEVRREMGAVKYIAKDKLELNVRLYLPQRKLKFNDIDNRLKDILDALQGFFHGGKGWKRKRPKPIIANDSQIYRVVAEKVDPAVENLRLGSGGGLLKIRRLSPAHRKRLHSWDSLWR